MNITSQQTVAFWEKVEKSPSHWYWRGSLSCGYGSFSVGRRTHRAHRVAYFLEHGRLDGDAFVAHHCDMRMCVRPDHLFETDQAGNAADMASKNRGGMGRGHKFSKAAIQDIRMRYATGRWSQGRLAREFDTSQTYISMIVLNKVRVDASRPADADRRRCCCRHLAQSHVRIDALREMCGVLGCLCRSFEEARR